MKRIGTTAALLTVAALLWYWPPTSTTSERPARLGRAPAPAIAPPVPVRSVTSDSSPASVPGAFRHRAAAVSTHCGLPIEPFCEDQTCVALTAAPDLDRLSGWLSLLSESPRFVLSTVGRDLGLPPDTIPCGAAIEALGDAVASVSRDDGSEVWCTIGHLDDAQRALCDEAASLRYGTRGFSDPDVRVLHFARSR